MKIENILSRLFDLKAIVNCEHDTYLMRWYVIRTKWFGLFIHKFLRSDEDRALHDHPWNFIVIPIWRGYIEYSERISSFYDLELGHRLTSRTPIKRRVYPIISSRYRNRNFRHRVELINNKPAWSIFIRFEGKRVWGFWLNNKFISSAKWCKDNKCE